MSKTKNTTAKKGDEKTASTKKVAASTKTVETKSTKANKSVDGKSTTVNKSVDDGKKALAPKRSAKKAENKTYEKRVLEQLKRFKNNPHTNLGTVLNGLIFEQTSPQVQQRLKEFWEGSEDVELLEIIENLTPEQLSHQQ